MRIKRGVDKLDKPFIRVRKKPVEVEAWMNDTGKPILIETLEGVMEARPGDWIIKGVNGELYPCKPDVFEKTYEFVEDEEG